MTSKYDDWETPQELFDEWNRKFRFDVDVCANASNAKCAKYFTPEQDGLKQEWRGACWCNPPYGRQIGKWIRKAYESVQGGATVVCLIPARTDTGYWHDWVMRGTITFLRGRVYFKRNGAPHDRAPFPSAIVVFGGIP